jgi:hypothetical protein
LLRFIGFLYVYYPNYAVALSAQSESRVIRAGYKTISAFMFIRAVRVIRVIRAITYNPNYAVAFSAHSRYFAEIS